MDDGGGRRVVDTMEGQDTHTGKHSVIASWVRHNFLVGLRRATNNGGLERWAGLAWREEEEEEGWSFGVPPRVQ